MNTAIFGCFEVKSSLQVVWVYGLSILDDHEILAMKDPYDVPVFFSALDQIAMKPKSPMKDKAFIWIGDRGGWGQVADFTSHPLGDHGRLLDASALRAT